MKTAAKVFLILSMVGGVIGFLSCLIVGIIGVAAGGASGDAAVAGASAIITIICGFVCLVPLIVGIIAYRRLDNSTYHRQLVGIGIVTLLFCSLVAGILMLVMHDEDLI